MYHHAALTTTDLNSLRGLKVLDIGCGKGGGLNFLNDYFEPSLAMGIDTSVQNINFARAAWPKIKFAIMNTDIISKSL